MNKNVLYKGDLSESLWGTLGYIGPMFIVSINYDKKSLFLRINGIRSALIFISFIIVNFPVILIKYNLVDFPALFHTFFMFSGFIFSILLFIDYCYAAFQTVNGIYKKTFFIDKVFNKFINKYMINKFL